MTQDSLKTRWHDTLADFQFMHWILVQFASKINNNDRQVGHRDDILAY